MYKFVYAQTPEAELATAYALRFCGPIEAAPPEQGSTKELVPPSPVPCHQFASQVAYSCRQHEKPLYGFTSRAHEARGESAPPKPSTSTTARKPKGSEPFTGMK